MAPAPPLTHTPAMPGWGSYSFAFGPVVALVAVVGLMMLLRWAFSGRSSLVAPPPKQGAPSEYGILEVVASPATRAEAEAMRQMLADAGCTATIVETVDGLRVMTWPAQAEQARALLETPPGQP